MALSSIQWTDFTENFWLGCSFARLEDGTSIPECFNCYAKLLDDNRFSKTLGDGTKENPVTHWGDSAKRHRTSEANWRNPYRWNKLKVCTNCGAFTKIDDLVCQERGCAHWEFRRPRVFSLSLGDWLDDKVPIEWLAGMLRVIHDTPNLDWLLLTKRPQNWRDRVAHAMGWLDSKVRRPSVSEHVEMQLDATLPRDRFAAKWGHFRRLDEALWCGRWLEGTAPSNVWIGVSAGADQTEALQIPARIHFLSCEPMLRPLDTMHAARFNWIIFGGESGSKARPCDVSWIRNGLEFCRKHGVAPFVKQFGSRPFEAASPVDPSPSEEARWMKDGWTKMVGFPGATWQKSFGLEDSHGGEMSEWPEEFRVREFPGIQ